MPALVDQARAQAKRVALEQVLTEEPASPPPRWPIHLAAGGLAAANAFDMATTIDAIRSGRGVEGNPLMAIFGNENLPAMGAMKGGMTALQVYVLEKLYPKKPKTALALAVAFSALPLAAGLHNRKVGR